MNLDHGDLDVLDANLCSNMILSNHPLSWQVLHIHSRRAGYFMKFDAFLVGIPIAFLAALAAPRLGAAGGPLHMGFATNIGVAVMFFLHGAALSLDHGFPARVIVPDNPGVHNTKWVTRMTFGH